MVDVLEEYSWDTEDYLRKDQVYVLIIYDIVENKRRTKLAKYLEGFGFRVQKSAFEAMLTKSKYEKLLAGLPEYACQEDSIKVYRMTGKGQVISFGMKSVDNFEEVVLI